MHNLHVPMKKIVMQASLGLAHRVEGSSLYEHGQKSEPVSYLKMKYQYMNVGLLLHMSFFQDTNGPCSLTAHRLPVEASEELM